LVKDRVGVKEVWAGVSVEAEELEASGLICLRLIAFALIAA